MRKQVPPYSIHLHTEESDGKEIKEMIAKWYVKLAMQQIAQLNHKERELLIQRVKEQLKEKSTKMN